MDTVDSSTPTPGRRHSRRTVLRGLASATAGAGLGAAFGTALGAAGAAPASAVDFGTVTWSPADRGTPINGLGFRIVTGDDDLRGPEGIEPASSITASVVVRHLDRTVTVNRWLNSDGAGWPNRSTRDRWMSFAAAGLPTVLAENIVSVRLTFVPNTVWSLDNWSMAALSVFYPKGDGLGDPAFVPAANGLGIDNRFRLLATGGGQPWLHRFRQSFDIEGGPTFDTVNPLHNPVLGQRNWRWCRRCQSLFFAGNTSSGACPLGGGHDRTGSANYVMPAYNAPLPPQVQNGWRWCRRCQGLFFGPFVGRCPLGGGHEAVGSSDYAMYVNDGQSPRMQVGWRSCGACQSMYFAGNGGSACAAGGGHDPTGSFQYQMAFSSREP
ncbi:hypothetical protein OHA72_53130 [Dactylosporangium sp. NBC_01737]|uniref:hypothetical protein n=1 Tax=Dactylosporangium sp. NBC_01737 TaxID=2975959 RepID=UPI002E150216|nr:hypothetical protein OHA72_53130 [Dactylosporangium sp. NBC_01737]